MSSKKIEEKGILAKLLEQGIRILIIKECKKVRHLNISIVASSIKIIQGKLKKINIVAEDINYKDLLFDHIELEANQIKINFNLTNKEFNFKNNPIIKFKISLSEKSIKTVLLSNNWNWIGNLISTKMLEKSKLEDIKIKNNKLFIKSSKDVETFSEGKPIIIKAENGKMYLINKPDTHSFQIPIEDKIYIENVNIERNLINVFAYSSVSF